MTPPAALKPIVDLWGRLNFSQRLTVSGAALATLALLGASIYFGSQEEYGVLFSDLKNSDAQAIVEKLKTGSVPYRLSAGGSTISVPGDRVTEMRLQLAGSGVLSGGHVGFDLFDRNSFGATDFTQRVNYQRALEGELARTLEGMDEVESARVHVTASRESIFTDKVQPSKASVVLRIRQGRELSRERTDSVINLLASAVEGLDPRDISVMDSRGRVLAAPDHDGARAKSGASQFNANLEVRQRLESEMAARIVELLEPVVGTGRVRANVAADIDFSQIESTAEKYDPQSSVIRSQQTSQESRNSNGRVQGGVAGARANDPTVQPDPAAQPTPTPPSGGDQRTASTTNYEIDKTITHTLNGTGKLTRLSASVVLDHKRENNNATARTPEELKKIQEAVAAAIGLDTTRGDQIVVQSLPFDVPPETKPSLLTTYRGLIQPLVKYGALLLIAALVLFFVIRPAQQALKAASTSMAALPAASEAAVENLTQLSPGEAIHMTEDSKAEPESEVKPLEGEQRKSAGALPQAEGVTIADLEAQIASELDPLRPEVVRSAEIRKRLTERVRANPQKAASTLRSWLREKPASKVIDGE